MPCNDKDKPLRDYVAMENIEPLQQAQLIKFYPELEKKGEEDETHQISTRYSN